MTIDLYLLTHEKYRDNQYLDGAQAELEGQWAGVVVAALNPKAAKALVLSYVHEVHEGTMVSFDGWRVKLISNRKRPGVIVAV